MPERSFHVVAQSFPIVYNRDGDHDPNGMLFTHARYVPLLEFAREQWERDDEYLPRAHRRDQLITMLLDGLERYEEMDEVLRTSLVEHADLLAYRGRPGGGEGDEEGHDLDTPPARREIAQHYRTAVDELATVLDELTDGDLQEVDPDKAVRKEWHAVWKAGQLGLRDAIEKQLQLIDQDLQAERPRLDHILGAHTVRRFLLNDHAQPQTVVRAQRNGYDRFNPMKPLILVRPLVLRARAGETVRVTLENSTRRPRVGLHRQGAGLGSDVEPGVRGGDGGRVGENPPSTATRKKSVTYLWDATTEGVWPLNDLADVRGTEVGTNVHGLFGAFIVEPTDATWHDPESGLLLGGAPQEGGGDIGALHVDVHRGDEASNRADFVDFATDRRAGRVRGFREFTVFFHDEPEIHSALHLGPEHTVMPISYRAEPMPNRLPHRMREYARRTAEEGTAAFPGTPASSGPVGQDLRAVKVETDPDTLAETFWIGRRADGTWIERVAGEEQHHSSWLFGDPATPVLRAYRGDPCRVRLVHGGVKETHVFHLHVHQWHAVPTDTGTPSTTDVEDRGSQLLDSITIGPQTGFDIDPLYGSGSRQRSFGDIIWHCHLYPHFHHGMWGLWRSFDREVDGSRPYPDGTPCPRLRRLPWRRPEGASKEHPGFPWFVDAGFPQKAPPPPAARDEHVQGRRRYLGLERASAREENAFAPDAEDRPGAPFVALDADAGTWNKRVGLPAPRVLSFDVEVTEARIDYNEIGWHDRHGHFYRLVGVAVNNVDHSEELTPARHEPFFPRANHGDVVELRLYNLLGTLPADHFDLTQLPVECGLHVHLVKFDVLAADGSSTGWNYLSGASCLEAVPGVHSPARPANVSLHRWVVDEEFGPCFFHDHLLANYRQKHGLFAALIAEPFGSAWEPAGPLTRALDPAPLRPAAAPLREDPEKVAWAGASAVIRPPKGSGIAVYREACLGLGDFVPLHDRAGKPLNPPGELGGDDDPGVMAVNYRNAPLTARGPDPSRWFATDDGLRARQEEPAPGEEDELELAGWLRDPETPIIETHPGERLRIRLVQGSHEEQHSFVAHGLRWRREWQRTASTLVNQQTIGISEAFTLDLDPQKGSAYGLGDHLWRFSAMDDLWLGCWGLVRSLPRDVGPVPLTKAPEVTYPPGRVADPRTYTVRARRIEHPYDGDRLTDPWGLVYEVVEADGTTIFEEGPEYSWLTGKPLEGANEAPQPLVLRCLPGEWVRVRLINEVRLPRDEQEAVPGWPADVSSFEDPYLPRFGPEPHPPALPLDEEHRTVSDRVSLHPALLQYDVRTDDGAYVGTNRDSTIRALPLEETDHGHGGDGGEVVHREGHGHERQNWRDYWWYADPSLGGDTGQVCYLHDMADIRNHRHHGLVGAIIVEPARSQPEHWTGTHTVVTLEGGEQVDEQVLFWQDGLRHYLRGNPDAPVPDVVPGDDTEDAGQKGINYRCALPPVRDPLADGRPPTPIWEAPTGRRLWLRLVGACDKPRNHTFTVHGRQWRVAPWLGGNSPETGGLSGLTADTVHDLDLGAVEHAGDHAYRSGVFRWAVTQGMWGILRVQ